MAKLTALNEVFRANLKAAMKAHPAISTQQGLSRALRQQGMRLGQSSVSRILNGNQSPTLDLVDKIARAFQLQAWQLLVPGFEPTNPPMTRQEDERLRALYARVQEQYSELQRAMQELTIYDATIEAGPVLRP